MTTAESVTAVRPGLSRTAKLILGGTALVVVVLRLAILSAPTLRDEGLYGYIAQEVLRGYLPMETATDNKGPVLYYLWAMALSLASPTSMEAIRSLGILFILGCGWTLFSLGKEMGGERVGLIAMGLFFFHTSLVRLDGHYYASEWFTMLPALLSVWLGWHAARSSTAWPAFLSGLLLGLAVWTRLTVVTWGVSVGLYLLYAGAPRNKLPRALAFTAGVALVSVFFLSLYAQHQQLGVFVEAFVLFPKAQSVTKNAFISESYQLLKIVRLAGPQTLLLWVPALLAVVSRRMDKDTQWFLFPWLAMALAGFLGTHLYLLKQTFLLYPPVCLLAAWQLEQWSRGRHRKAALWFVVLNVLFNIGWNTPKYLGLLRNDPSVSVPIITQGAKVADWIKSNTRPDDYFFNWGVEWEVYFGSERRSPTRHMNVLLLVMMATAVDGGEPINEEFDRIQKEVIAGLEAHPPEVIAVTAGVKNYDLEGYYLPAYFDTMLRTRYDLLFQEEPYWIFRRKPSDRQPQPASNGKV